jgi:NAD(P)H dehydrogenase (quinone)
MILVTGAAGKTGRAVIGALHGRGGPIRAMVHRPEQYDAVKQAGATEAIAGDMRQAKSVAAAMAGVQAVYHICPNVSPDEVVIGQAAISAARAAGVERFVYHSVLHPQTEEMPHHWLKLQVESILLSSGIPFTILQPAAYMQNIMANWDSIVELGVYPVPYPPETRIGLVDLQDVARVAAVVLTEPGHEGATYELAGSQPLSQGQVARALSQVLMRDVGVEQIAIEEWRRAAVARGLGEYQVDTLIKMFRYYERFGFWGNPRVLTLLLGRAPVTFADFVRRQARAE